MYPLIDALIKNIVPVIALLISFLSAYYSYRNGNIAKEAVKISANTFQNKQSNFSLYLKDCFRFVKKTEHSKKILLFHVVISNVSENKNSFKAILEINYIREDNSIVKMLFQHSPQLIDLIPQKELKIFDDDIRVDEKSSQSKWLIFEQPVAFFEQYKIDKYVIRVRDVNDVDKEVEVVLIKEIKDETV